MGEWNALAEAFQALGISFTLKIINLIFFSFQLYFICDVNLKAPDFQQNLLPIFPWFSLSRSIYCPHLYCLLLISRADKGKKNIHPTMEFSLYCRGNKHDALFNFSIRASDDDNDKKSAAAF